MALLCSTVIVCMYKTYGGSCEVGFRVMRVFRLVVLIRMRW